MEETIPSGVCLKNLIQNCHAEILGREKNNDRFIHLYSIGTYWVAFERSACRLDSIFRESEISLFRVGSLSDYIVMVSVAGDEMSAYFYKHVVCHDEPEYKVLVVSSLPTEFYNRWHAEAVKSVLQ